MASIEKRYLALRQSSDSACTYPEVSGEANDTVIEHRGMKPQTLFSIVVMIVLLWIIAAQAVHTVHLQDTQGNHISPSMPPPTIKSSVYQLTLFSMV